VILMGLDTVIVAFFVIGIIVFVAGTLTLGANNLIKSSYEGYSAFSKTTMERLHTDIEVNNASFNETNKHVYLTVENTGETKLSDYDLWDVFVVKNKTQTSYLNKDAGFKLFTLIGDTINPGILDPHESIDIELLSPEFNSGDNLLIRVITENGIGSSINYTVS
jgi:archaeal flagellar protein FlaF